VTSIITIYTQSSFILEIAHKTGVLSDIIVLS